MIVANGNIYGQGSQFSLNDVEVVTATVDLDDVRSVRFPPSRRMQASASEPYHRINLNEQLTLDCAGILPTVATEPHYVSPEEEIALGPACWWVT